MSRRGALWIGFLSEPRTQNKTRPLVCIHRGSRKSGELDFKMFRFSSKDKQTKNKTGTWTSSMSVRTFTTPDENVWIAGRSHRRCIKHPCPPQLRCVIDQSADTRRSPVRYAWYFKTHDPGSCAPGWGDALLAWLLNGHKWISLVGAWSCASICNSYIKPVI